MWIQFPTGQNVDKKAFAEVLRFSGLLTGCELLPKGNRTPCWMLVHCINKNNWANRQKNFATVASEFSKEREETAIVRSGRETLVISKPGKDGAILNASAEKVCVVTGIFPEVILIWRIFARHIHSL